MSNLLLLLINTLIRFVSWEEHCPWVRSEFIFVNYSLTVLIYFSTGSKTITLLLEWFGKEKPHKVTKQAAGEDSGLRFSEWYKEEKWQEDATVTKKSNMLVHRSSTSAHIPLNRRECKNKHSQNLGEQVWILKIYSSLAVTYQHC